MNATDMLGTHPRGSQVDATLLAVCIEHCYTCSQTCSACADACLGEEEVAMLARCISTDINCADICLTTGKILTRQTEFLIAPARELLQACLTMCRLCADDCDGHAEKHKHCALCATACRDCAEACRKLLEQLV